MGGTHRVPACRTQQLPHRAIIRDGVGSWRQRPEMKATITIGAKARTPSLWLYSSNDLYWGPDYPREWFAAYRKAGGRARFVALPPYGTDGHQSFSRNRDGWRDAVMQFLRNPQ